MRNEIIAMWNTRATPSESEPSPVASGRTDTDRLNWLQANYESIERMGGKWWSVNIEEWSPSIRSAIDAAMQSEKPSPPSMKG